MESDELTNTYEKMYLIKLLCHTERQ